MRTRQRLAGLPPSRWASLRARMTISYVAVTIGVALAFLLPVALVSGTLAAFVPGASAPSSDFYSALRRQAQTYALVAGYQARGAALDPAANFVPGRAHSIAVMAQDSENQAAAARFIATSDPDPAAVAVALLVAPGGQVRPSSYPARYPAGMAVAALAPAQARAIAQALAGHAASGMEQHAGATLGYAAEPVWSDAHQPIGAIWLQVPGPQSESLLSRLWSALSRVALLLLLVTPIGLLFGWIAARDPVRRVRRLVAATTTFAAGEYTQRVTSEQHDEIGQLERQFNQMAEQLAESIARRQQLAEQNARLAERSRISRELHDAVAQDLFSLRLLGDGLREAARAGSSAADLRPQIALLERTTGNMTREMRALLLELRPTPLEHLDLAGALGELARGYSARLGLAVDADIQPVVLDAPREHALLRIAQEALANAARHSSAARVTLRLAGEGATVRLTIADDGAGFAAADGTTEHGLGLRIMRERVAELGGTFALESAPGAGTRIAVAIPAAPATPAAVATAEERADD